jgi:hypothetical protein
MALRVRKKRNINIGEAASSSEALKESRARGADRAIQNHPRYLTILSALREGQKPSKIGRWFASNGWLEVSETSFTQSLYIFRRRHPELIHTTDTDMLDSMVEANRPDLDVITELDRLLRVQKARIAIDFKTEKNINKLFGSTHKEVQVAAMLLELMLKAKGALGGGSEEEFTSNFNMDLPIEVRERLRSIKVNENNRQKLFSLTQEFASKVDVSKKKITTT